jgi:TolB-like protein/DNA-binding SARP family transcriptional activator/Flp pilus assembly protein TadD
MGIMSPAVATLFGAPSLTDGSGARIEPLLAQPKRFAVLAYLLVEARGTPVMRDKLAALFWPELDQPRARQALRQSLHVIRKELGEGAIVGVGAEMLALGQGAVVSDVAQFEEALAAGRRADALELYRGTFLDGFHVSEAPGVDAWAAAHRVRLGRAAAAAAGALADAAEQAGHLDDAARWLRLQLSFAEIDERPLRRLMGVLRAQGNAAAAVAAYDDYAAWLHREMELEPSDESAALADEIRKAVASTSPTPSRESSPYATSMAGASSAGGPRPGGLTRILPRVAFAATIVLAVVATAFAARRFGFGESDRPGPSVAVLPFLDLSPGKEQQYLGDGLTEELITALAEVRGLRVPARTSSFAFRDTRSDIRAIARRLGVTTVLEGSVRVEGERLRVTAQLINAESGYHIWTQNFDRPMADVLAVQNEIATAIARALRVELVGPTAATGSGNAGARAAAHTAYLKGRFFWNQRDADGIRTAIETFGEATRLDPGYAPAFAGLASALQLAPNFTVMAPDSAFPRALAAVQRALALDPDLAEAHASLGFIRLQWEHDLPAAHRELERAISLAPGYATAWQWLRLYHIATGKLDAALAAARRARDLDPVSASIQCALADVFLVRRQFDSAMVAFGEALRLSPDFDRALSGMARVYSLRGEHAEAVRLAERSVARPPRNARYVGTLGLIYGRAGRRTDALLMLDSVRFAARRGYAPPYAFLMAHTGLGNVDSTLHWLGRAVAERDAFAVELRPYPEFDDLRSDPRFAVLLGQVGGPGR